MMCIPPYQESSYPFGDLVPLGFLLKALKTAENDPFCEPAISQLTAFLLKKKQGKLWAFHTDHLITATDSALILLGIHDTVAVEELEIFHDGKNGYYPQLWSEKSEPDHMLISDSYRIWCQTDYATTCFIRGLRIQNGYAAHTSITYLADGFDRRSGLFFANPYLVDWAFSMAVKNESQAVQLQKKLIREILASQNSDGAFGCFDILLSTSLAVITLKTLGFRGIPVHRAQCWIADYINKQKEPDKAIPFYSATLVDYKNMLPPELILMKFFNEKHIAKIGEKLFAISYYEDTGNIIGSALACLALADEENVTIDDANQHSDTECQPRYRCKSHAEYISRYALTPFTDSIS